MNVAKQRINQDKFNHVFRKYLKFYKIIINVHDVLH